MITRTASARYEGFGKEGKGHVSTQSGVLSDTQYGFNTRLFAFCSCMTQYNTNSEGTTVLKKFCNGFAHGAGGTCLF